MRLSRELRSNKQKILCLSICLLIAPHLPGESRTWTSTSGSTVEASYLGTFGEDLWFKAETDGRFLKMPEKYVSAADLETIASGVASPQIDPKIIDAEDSSLALLEQLLNTKTEVIDEGQSLEVAVKHILSPLRPPNEEAVKTPLKFHRKVDLKAQCPAPIIALNAYDALQQLANSHALKWSIREGIITIRLR